LFDKPAASGNCADSLTGPARPAAEWVTVEAEVHVKGTTKIFQYPDTAKPVLTCFLGKHGIELVNGPLDYRETRTLQVTPGKVSTIDVTLPKGTVSINAVPWASVSIDGQSIGDTPIANISLTIGPHEVVLKNTTLGEQRRVITVTQNSPVRLGVDMAKK